MIKIQPVFENKCIRGDDFIKEKPIFWSLRERKDCRSQKG